MICALTLRHSDFTYRTIILRACPKAPFPRTALRRDHHLHLDVGALYKSPVRRRDRPVKSPRGQSFPIGGVRAPGRPSNGLAYGTASDNEKDLADIPRRSSPVQVHF
jgi:hypothetical protein